MINILERQKDILSIIDSVDISPTMYDNAVKKYKAITDFLGKCGIEAEIYPQGSFACGTVVRPHIKDQLANYDLDFICQLKGNKSDYSPSSLRSIIEDALKSNEVYEEKLVIEDECFTIEYADINGIGFSIDIVPAVEESDDVKMVLISKSLFPELLNTAIAIPKKESDSYTWITNNPKGFSEWFKKINEPFLEYNRESYRQHLFEMNSNRYTTVEDIPSDLERTSLQRVIQILKYHRNLYYSKINGNNIKPISAIINTVAAKIAKDYKKDCSVFELLEHVLKELKIYSEHLNLTQKSFSNKYANRSIFSRENGKWHIANPANPEDNLADQWNDNKLIPETFFRWVSVVYDDLIVALNGENVQFRVAIENGLGKKVVTSILGNKYLDNTIVHNPITNQNVAKPYGGV